MSAQAAKEKEKGNAAFKAGDFPTAIGHYTAAMLADPNYTDPTFPLNRAAAYLKLGKFEDAERDCSTVIKLNKGNVKALFRRSQARSGMGRVDDALEDLREALYLEPANQSVKDELEKLGKIANTAARKSKLAVPRDVSSTPTSSTASLTTASKKAKSSSKPSNDLMTPVSSRPLTTSGPTPSTSATTPKPKPSSFKEAKAMRDTTKPSYGGGIFRASGEHTLFTPQQAEKEAEKMKAMESKLTEKKSLLKPVPAENPTPTEAPKAETQVESSAPEEATIKPAPPSQRKYEGKTPSTLFEFTRAWEVTEDDGVRMSLLSRIPPANIPTLFQSSLEPETFVQVVDVLASSSEAKEQTEAYMRAFERVPRFATVVRMLSAKERERVRGLWDTLGFVGGGEGKQRPEGLAEVWGAVYRW